MRLTAALLPKRALQRIVTVAVLTLPRETGSLHPSAWGLDFRNASGILDRRTDLCDRAAAVSNGTLEMMTALRGVHLTAVATQQRPENQAWFSEPVNNTDTMQMTGFHAELMKAVAARAGFTFEIWEHPRSAFKPGMSWTEYATVAGEKFDLMVDGFVITDGRLGMAGLRTPYQFLDYSLVAAKRAQLIDATFWVRFFRFTSPFAPRVWAAFIVLSLATSILYYIVEKQGDKAAHGSISDLWVSKIIKTFFRMGRLYDADSAAPQTGLGKLLYLGHSFVIVVGFALYTANLASLLVAEKSIQICGDVNSCLQAGNRICVDHNSATDEWLTKNFREWDQAGQIVRCTEPGGEWTCESMGQCEVVVQPKLTLAMQMRNKTQNGNCDIHRVGIDYLAPFHGGWLAKIDYHDRCTSLLIDALETHLLALEVDGTILALQNTLVKAKSSRSDCQKGKEKKEGLDLNEMVGLLLIHFTVVMVVLVAMLLLMARERWGCCTPFDGWIKRHFTNKKAEPISMEAVHADVLRISQQLEKLGNTLKSEQRVRCDEGDSEKHVWIQKNDSLDEGNDIK
eukprot:CAMPEP_0194306800 /NCGR_PEP_ID=MMETSP0171-20130528/3806_1 /TAXON_ID=218684 /ORGANISM="Corethron pennatum, Strain L29A3" /LENGTH=566 /DNA_ID=CAMNT_0039058647 /DNA_START=125 /DNA_END=1825 /DNA_ORIENTATION=+